ncbi:MAG: ABC transporter ATP-binding protein [Brevinematales bacterium]|nr:ABC transporter ATP-binding protein [Brevinematales bacterium]
MKDYLLTVKNLTITLADKEKDIKIVDDISYSIKKNETLCMVGESGCGKTVSALSITRLLPSPPFKIDGQIFLEDREILSLPIEELYKIRGKEIGFIFQEPLSSFNPVEKIGDQIAEVVRIHENFDKKTSKEMVYELLHHVGFKNPKIQYELYPHELSGGMRQRAMIAMAIILKPKLLIADEPTTALDVTIQAQVLNLIEKLKDEYGLSILFITHNLGIVAQISENVLVLYAGQIVEYSRVFELFKDPLHPYTIGLLNSVPSLTKIYSYNKSIQGNPPEPTNIPSGCPFHPRCNRKMKICETKNPPFIKIENRYVKCWLYSEEKNAHS